MLLHLSTWAEIEAYLKHKRSILIPMGSTEQHGPNGLLGTDWLCPELIAQEVERLQPDILVGPTFNVGMAQHHLAFCGTISLRPSTFIAVIGDWIRSLVLHGFEKIYFLNGHGGNIASTEAGFSEFFAEASFTARRAGCALYLRNWWEFASVKALAEQLYPEGHGIHATPSEVAVTQWGYPQAIKQVDYAAEIPAIGPVREALDFRARYPDGRVGSDPAQATPDHGSILVRTAAEAVISEWLQIES